MALPVQVALFQGGLAAPFVENLEILRGRAHEAKEKGAHLIIAPEVFFTGYGVGDRLKSDAVLVDGAEMRAISELAQKTEIAICVGYSERAGEKVYNSLAFFDASGKLLQNYHKIQLYAKYANPMACMSNATSYEKQYFESGNEILPPFEWKGWKIGLLICFDVEYPEPARVHRIKGANFIISVAANTSAFTTRVTVLQRAQENNIYLAYVNRVGRENNLTFCGGTYDSLLLTLMGYVDSVMVAPNGTEVARCSNTGPDLQIASLNWQDPRWEKERAYNPYIEGRRPHLYAAVTQPFLSGDCPVVSATPNAPAKAQMVQFADDLLFSSQPSVSQLCNLNLLGIKSVLNMRCIDETGFIPYEEQVLQEQGIKYAQLGVRSANDIDAKYTDKALAILKEMPKPVLVHCAAGLTAAMISCIRVAKENGATSSDVLGWGTDLGFNFANQAQFYAFVTKYLPS